MLVKKGKDAPLLLYDDERKLALKNRARKKMTRKHSSNTEVLVK